MNQIQILLDNFNRLKRTRKRTDWQGKKGEFEMYEVENFISPLKVIRDIKEAIDELNPDLEWALSHFNERVGGEPLNPPPSHEKWNKDTEKFFMEGTQKFSHTYPERFWPKKLLPKGIRFDTADLETLIQVLNQNIETRQGFFPIFFNEDVTCSVEGERVPCTLGYYFYKDFNGRLSCNYIIRSVDVIRHLHNDLFLTWLLLDWVNKSLNTPLELGKITLIAFNAHCFVNDDYTLNKRIHQLEGAKEKRYQFALRQSMYSAFYKQDDKTFEEYCKRITLGLEDIEKFFSEYPPNQDSLAYVKRKKTEMVKSLRLLGNEEYTFWDDQINGYILSLEASKYL